MAAAAGLQVQQVTFNSVECGQTLDSFTAKMTIAIGSGQRRPVSRLPALVLHAVCQVSCQRAQQPRC